MKKGKMSESGLTGLKDKQDFESKKILIQTIGRKEK
jgi:hypothetical protein